MPANAITTATAAIGRVRTSVAQVSDVGKLSPIRSLIGSFPGQVIGQSHDPASQATQLFEIAGPRGRKRHPLRGISIASYGAGVDPPPWAAMIRAALPLWRNW